MPFKRIWIEVESSKFGARQLGKRLVAPQAVSAVRTAIGKFGGALKDIPPTELAGKVVCQGVQRSGLSPSDIGHVVFGNVIHTDAKDMYLSRVAALRGGHTC